MKNLFKIGIALIGIVILLITGMSFVPVKEEKKVTIGSDIEVQYCGSQKFYVLKDGNYGYNVAFIKAN